MIFYVPLPKGEDIPIDYYREPLDIASIVMSHYVHLQILQPNIFDVTPAIWSHSNPRHELTVYENGEGLYRVLPKNVRVGSAELSNVGLGSRLLLATRTSNVNRDHPLSLVTGGHPSRHKEQLFGIIGYAGNSV